MTEPTGHGARACLILLLLLAMFALPAAAETITTPKPVVLKEKMPARELVGHIAYLLDPTQGLAIQDILKPENASRFRLSDTGEPAFGYRADHIWLHIPVSNHSPMTEEWKLHLHNNFLHVMEVYVVHLGGRVEAVMSLRYDSPFADRPLEYHQLVADFRIRTGATADLYLRYQSGGHTGLRPTIESNSSFEALATDKAAKSFLFQGILLLLMLAGLAGAIAFRTFTPLAYGLYLLTCSLFVLHWDGYAFQYLWPGLPRFNANASLIIGCMLVVSSTTYVRSYLKSWQNYPIVDKVLIANIALAIGLLLAGMVMDTQPLKKAMVMVASASPVIFFAAGVNAARREFKSVRFFVIGWVGVILSAGLMTGRNLLNIEISRDLVVDSMRIVIVFDALMMGLALLDRYAQERNAQRRALQENLEITQRNLEMHGRLSRLEQRFELARDLAERRGQRLADTTHDLRQPLHALRLTVQRMVDAGSIDVPAASTIGKSFEYLEDLVETSLAEASRDIGSDTEATVYEFGSAAPDMAAIPVGSVLRQVHEMFADDAAAKGLTLTWVPCSAEVSVNALTLMRIVSNLVSNAVKYTAQGRILIGCRRKGDRLSVEVHDTGPGMTVEEFDHAVARSVRLSGERNGTSGHGLGLSIVATLTRQHDYPLRHGGGPDRGTCVAVEVPVAPQPLVIAPAAAAGS